MWCRQLARLLPALSLNITKQRRVVSVNGKFECEQCHKSYSKSSNLKAHKQSVHEGKKYACDQCDYQATLKNTLTVHIQSKNLLTFSIHPHPYLEGGDTVFDEVPLEMQTVKI